MMDTISIIALFFEKVKYDNLDANGNTKTKWSTMFPDSKSEIQVAKSVESVFKNNVTKFDSVKNLNYKQGTDATGVTIRINLFSNGSVSTAYPIFN